MRVAGLVLTYGRDTWPPRIMAYAGCDAKGSLAYYGTSALTAGVAWCAGFGRLGGPLVGAQITVTVPVPRPGASATPAGAVGGLAAPS